MCVTSLHSCPAQAYRNATRGMDRSGVLDLLVAVETNVSGLNRVTVGVPQQAHAVEEACDVVNDADFKCSWTHKLKYLGPDYFPSLVIETECAECGFVCRQKQPGFMDGGVKKKCDVRSVPRALAVLKRTQRGGFDDWELQLAHPDQISVGCRCTSYAV